MADIYTILDKINRKDLTLSEKELDILQKWPTLALDYIKASEFKIIPKKLLDAIKNDWIISYQFLLNANIRNIDILNYIELIEIVSEKDSNYSKFLFKLLDYKNIPECLIVCAKKSRLIQDKKIKQCVLEYDRKQKLEKLLK